jgi:uncharacterized protein YkwD
MLHWISPDIEYHGRLNEMNYDVKRLSGVVLLACLVLALLSATVGAATTSGYLYVSSSPRGAQIWLDNASTGKITSAYIMNVPAGRHTVTLKLAGYQDKSQTVQVTAGRTTYLSNVILAKAGATPTPTQTLTGTISVSSSPGGAQIWLDSVNTGKVTSSSISNVPAGSHLITLKLAGYQDKSQTVQVTAGSTAYLSNSVLVRIITPVPTQTIPPGGSQIFNVEQAIFTYTNIARQNNGKPALVWDAKLATAARAHAEDMATNKFFSHTSSDGRTPGQRLNAIGYYSWGENIAATGYYNLNSNPDAVGKALVDMWMGSSGHKANILGTSIDFNRIGVGVAYNSQYYGYLATQDFARV